MANSITPYIPPFSGSSGGSSSGPKNFSWTILKTINVSSKSDLINTEVPARAKTSLGSDLDASNALCVYVAVTAFSGSYRGTRALGTKDISVAICYSRNSRDFDAYFILTGPSVYIGTTATSFNFSARGAYFNDVAFSGLGLSNSDYYVGIWTVTGSNTVYVTFTSFTLTIWGYCAV